MNVKEGIRESARKIAYMLDSDTAALAYKMDDYDISDRFYVDAIVRQECRKTLGTVADSRPRSGVKVQGVPIEIRWFDHVLRVTKLPNYVQVKRGQGNAN
jgi:hypothetical protein